MSQLFEAAQQRLGHVQELIQIFDQRSMEVLQKALSQVIREERPEGDWTLYSWRIPSSPAMDESLQFWFGDAVHNLRAVCDNLMSYLRAKRQITGQAGFPVCKDQSGKKGFSVSRVNLKAYGDDVLDVIESLQPFNHHTIAVPTLIGTMVERQLTGDAHPLWILNKLSNIEKHEVPLALMSDSKGPHVTFQAMEVREAKVTGGEIEQGGMELLSYKIRSNEQVVEPHLALTISMSKSTPVAPGRRADTLLSQLHDFVKDYVVESFRPFL